MQTEWLWANEYNDCTYVAIYVPRNYTIFRHMYSYTCTYTTVNGMIPASMLTLAWYRWVYHWRTHTCTSSFSPQAIKTVKIMQHRIRKWFDHVTQWMQLQRREPIDHILHTHAHAHTVRCWLMSMHLCQLCVNILIQKYHGELRVNYYTTAHAWLDG